MGVVRVMRLVVVLGMGGVLVAIIVHQLVEFFLGRHNEKRNGNWGVGMGYKKYVVGADRGSLKGECGLGLGAEVELGKWGTRKELLKIGG